MTSHNTLTKFFRNESHLVKKVLAVTIFVILKPFGKGGAHAYAFQVGRGGFRSYGAEAETAIFVGLPGRKVVFHEERRHGGLLGGSPYNEGP
ncbi:hypothetical protein SDC9_169470 [bioreactor metagenome]|uniref:Uncharacterized protein n=1 Tax=bioreactor metagenome TaxID=1076179 RepID=A0A645G598_9ZZZZ